MEEEESYKISRAEYRALIGIYYEVKTPNGSKKRIRELVEIVKRIHEAEDEYLKAKYPCPTPNPS